MKTLIVPWLLPGCLFFVSASAADLQQGDVTVNLTGTLFMDDAVTGGGDVTVEEPANAGNNRYLDLSGAFVATMPATPPPAPGETGTLSIQGFGFATNASAASNDATSLTITITYLGLDEAPGGGDDVTIGSETVGYTHVGAGEYYVNFDGPIATVIDGAGSRFRINIAPTKVGGGGTLRLKSAALAFETFNGSKLSLSGTFNPAGEDSDNDGIDDVFETAGLMASGPLGTFNGPTDTGTWSDVQDSDGDGILDGEEVFGEPFSGFSYTSNPTTQNSDGDGISDGDEVEGNLNSAWNFEPTNPSSNDTDEDGINDDVEIANGTNPAAADSDGDGLDDSAEDLNGDGILDPGETDPVLVSTDGDSLPDGWEVANGLDPRDDGSIAVVNGDDGDFDEDLLTNVGEYNGGFQSSDPNDKDSDNDLLDDKQERDLSLNPANRDSDNDRLGDGYEVANGFNATADADFDMDGFKDADEILFYGSDAKEIASFPGDGTAPGPGELTPILDGGNPIDEASTLGSTIVAEALTGGSDFTFGFGDTSFTAVYENALPGAGSAVTITGFAWVVTGSGANAAGDILVEFFDPGSDGVFDGIDTDTKVGSAVGTLSPTGATTIMYWNFDTPINFVSAGSALAVKIQSTSSILIKGVNFAGASGKWFDDDGRDRFGDRRSYFSIGGTVSFAQPGILTLTRTGTTNELTWDLGDAPSVDLERSTDLGLMDSWTKVLTGTTMTSYTEISSDPDAFFRLVTP